MRTALATAACLAALALTPASGAQAAAVAKDCGSASYGSSAPLSSTHYGVANVKAWKTRCGKARKIALASEGKGGQTYTKDGYRCRPGAMEEGIRPYTCTKIKKTAEGTVPKVRFRTWGNG
jgi:hypothetical protein